MNTRNDVVSLAIYPTCLGNINFQYVSDKRDFKDIPPEISALTQHSFVVVLLIMCN